MIKAKQELLTAAAQMLAPNQGELTISNGGVSSKKKRASYGEIVKTRGRADRRQKDIIRITKSGRRRPCALRWLRSRSIQRPARSSFVGSYPFIMPAKVLNPLLHDGQIDGGIVMGVGYALTEEMLFAEGKVTTLHFGDYKIPTIRDLPQLQKIVLEAPVGRGPYNSMSIGETPIITVAPAIANAVDNAVGVRITSLPLTAEKVLASIQNQVSDQKRGRLLWRRR